VSKFDTGHSKWT